MSLRRTPSHTPVIAALCGGAIAVGSGLLVMAQSGAPPFYMVMNGTAVGVGLALAALLRMVPPRTERWLALAAALALLATALWGVEIEGIRRWASLLGFVQIQPTFLLLPLLLCMAARRHGDPYYAAALIIAAIAVALQPDRSMTMPLIVVAFAIWLADRGRSAALVLVVTGLAGIVTYMRSDPLIGVRFVEQMIMDGWQAGADRGAVLTLGALAMLAPFAFSRRVGAEQQRATIAFTLCWASLLAASIVAPYPTPLLGYGSSAIIGYFLSIIALRKSPVIDPPVARGTARA